MQSMNIWQQLAYYFSHNGMYVLSEFSRHFLISIFYRDYKEPTTLSS